MRTCLLLGLAGLATACTTAIPGRQHAAFWRTNGYDRHGEQQGRWRTYYDEEHNERPYTSGRYRHGRPVGHWRYYAQPGTLDHEEHYRRQFSDITFYYPNGQIARQGRAQVADEHPNIHYYWFGNWREFSDTGQLLRVDTYTKGRLVGTKAVNGQGSK